MRHVNSIFSISGYELVKVVNPFHDPVLFLYPLKTKKISSFVMFTGGIKGQWHEMD